MKEKNNKLVCLGKVEKRVSIPEGCAYEVYVPDETSFHLMDGDDELEKWLNGYLTSHFVIREDAPSDECLDEAKKIIEKVKKFYGY